MIRVIYNNGEEDQVPPKFLDILLFLNEVEKFQRSGNWVSVSSANLRQSPGNYSGKERRRHTQTALQPFAMENQPAKRGGRNQPVLRDSAQ